MPETEEAWQIDERELARMLALHGLTPRALVQRWQLTPQVEHLERLGVSPREAERVVLVTALKGSRLVAQGTLSMLAGLFRP